MPRDILDAIERDEWAEPVDAALRATQALLDLANGNWAHDGVTAAQSLRKSRPDSPLLLAVTEVALDPDCDRATAGLRDIQARLENHRWTMDVAYEAAGYASLGILSLGLSTTSVLEALIETGQQVPELRTASRAFRRGLLHLPTPITLTAAATADCVLLPTVARHNHRLWTTAGNAKVAHEALSMGKAVLPLVHPVSEMSPLTRQSFRPASYITDVSYWDG